MKPLGSKKYLFSVLIPIITVSCFAINGCKKEDVVKKEKQLVITSPVIEKKISKSVTYVGLLEPEDSIDLKARVKGFLVKQNFKDGDFVKKGELLFVIDKKEFKTAVDKEKARLDNFIAEKKAVDIDYKRNKYLADKKAVSKVEYEEALSKKEKADANIAACKANIEQAELNLSYTDIYAPFDGKIGVGTYSIGDIVGPTTKTLATLIKLNPIRVNFNVSESILTSILFKKKKIINSKDKKSDKNENLELLRKKINPVLILSNGVEYNKKGNIFYVDNKIDKSTGTVLIKALYPNPKFILLPGGHVRIKLEQAAKTEALLIPQQSIQEDQAGEYVLIVNKDNVVETKRIKTGMIFGGDIVLKKGLIKGERVIIEGSLKVRPGEKVNVKNKQQNQNAEKIVKSTITNQ